MSRPRLLALMALTTLLAAPLPTAAPAAPQTWEYYTYAQSGFTVQFPAPPATSVGTYKTRDGAAVPSLTWAVQQDGVAYSVMVADFSSRPMNDQSAMNDAIATLKETGEIKVDTNERIDRNFGHDITLVGKDGSRSAIAIFYVGNRLYELIGKALAPTADAGTARTVRREGPKMARAAVRPVAAEAAQALGPLAQDPVAAEARRHPRLLRIVKARRRVRRSSTRPPRASSPPPASTAPKACSRGLTRRDSSPADT